MRISLLKRRKFLYCSAGIFVLLLGGCISVYSPRSGIVVEEVSGRPIENAILVRSWDRGYATPAGAVHYWLATTETTTDEKGRFSFWPRVFFAGIPLLMWTEENSLLVYRPGYGCKDFKEHKEIVELPKIAFNRYARDAEVQKAQSSYETDFDKTNLLKSAVQEEEKLLKELPSLTKGILYTMSSLNDVAIDKNGNIYLADYWQIVKIPKTDTGYDRVNIGQMTIYNTSGPIELETDNNHLYALRGSYLLRIDISAANEESSPLATKQYDPRRGLVKHRMMTGRPAQKTPKSSTPSQMTSAEVVEPEVLARGDQSKFPFHGYRFAICRDGMICIGESRFQTNGSLVDRQPINVSALRTTPPKVVDSATDDAGNTAVAFFYPSEPGPTRSGIALYDENHRYGGAKILPLQQDVTGISAAAGRYYACDRNSFYILNNEFELISRHTLPHDLFGEYDLTRIKVDAAGENLFLIDSRYSRLLWYDLKTNDWR